VILRVTAALVVALGLVALLAFLQVVGKAPWSPPAMRHLRAMKERTAAPDSIAPIAFADFDSLPARLSPAECARIERRGVALDCYVQRLLTASDGDIHFELVETPRTPARPDTAYVTAELTPQWAGGSAAWGFESLVALLRPMRGGAVPWPAGPRRARISGWLLDDFQNDERPTAGAVESHRRRSDWEIHPITRIELWSDSLGRFVDVPR